MALDLVNFVRNQPDILGQAFEGYKMGAAVRNDMQAQQAAIMQQEKARQRSDMINAFIQKPNKTAADYSNMILAAPEMQEQFKASYDLMNEGKKKNLVDTSLDVFAALQNGRNDTAKMILDRQIEAAQNSGDAQEVQRAQVMREMIDMNPQAAQSAAGLFLSHAVGGEKMAEVLGGFSETRRAEELHPLEMKAKRADIQKKGAEIGLTQAQINKTLSEARKIGFDIQKTDAETMKTLLEVEAARQNKGYLSPKEKFSAENTLRTQVTDVLKKNRDVLKANNQMKAILNELPESGAILGAADAAAVVTFFKTIDPNSTVTATEGGIIQGAEGLQGQIAAIWNRALNQGKFTKDARDALVKISDRLYEPVAKEAKEIERKYTKIAERNGLNPDNIFIQDFDAGGPAVSSGDAKMRDMIAELKREMNELRR